MLSEQQERERCHDTRAHHRGARDSLESETSNLLTSFTVRLPIYAAQLQPNEYSVLEISQRFPLWNSFSNSHLSVCEQKRVC